MEQPAAEQKSAAACLEERRSADNPAIGETTAEPVRARGKTCHIWPIAAAILLSVTTGGIVYLPRILATASIPTTASTPTPNLPVDASTPDPGLVPLTPAQIEALVERGSTLVTRGELVTARLAYEAAVNAGEAQAALYLGKTYDPYFLKWARFGKAARGDFKTAEYWYRRARELGSNEAQAWLSGITNSRSPH